VTRNPPTGCDQLDSVAEYVLRSLPAEESSAFEAHVGACSECRAELEALRPIVNTFDCWPTDVLRPPAPLWEHLARRIGMAAEPGSGPARETRWADEPDWCDVAPGIAYKLLSSDPVTGSLSMLVRLAPGAAYPPHSHASVEELHLLDGELWIDGRKLLPGDYNRAEPGTADSHVWSETGCTCVLMTSSGDILR